VLAISEALVTMLNDDEVSKRFLYTFRDAVAKLIGDDDNLIVGLPSDLVDEEFKRLIERAYKMKGEQLEDTSRQAISQTIALWTHLSTFTKFLGFLEIITFIARESK
jgi:fructose-1-phosphate kinase PfkB-like protein